MHRNEHYTQIFYNVHTHINLNIKAGWKDKHANKNDCIPIIPARKDISSFVLV